MFGNVHSIESFGTVDGPGIRLVVFLQGCPMRCLYCHNPDTWSYEENKKVFVSEILDKYDSIKEFLKNGGITVTGGEPLSQIDFVTELFKQAKQKNIHTALDTSGVLFNRKNLAQFDKLLKYTDLVLLDIKHINDEEHKKLTGFSNKNILDFAMYLSEKNIPIWVRHVVVPTITDDEKHLKELGKFLANIKSLKALDVLPYHNMAISKYENLNIDYPLKNISPLTKEEAMKARQIIINSYKQAKQN
ncbi:TPA: pyruvate formate lyase-activating protein [Candidatus Avigastranaerophilus faecigallinarum]|nr:pyruvate formate lyase-activating protein [Candidatus Avigastranaerophilus faecigallinarum]